MAVLLTIGDYSRIFVFHSEFASALWQAWACSRNLFCESKQSMLAARRFAKRFHTPFGRKRWKNLFWWRWGLFGRDPVPHHETDQQWRSGPCLPICRCADEVRKHQRTSWASRAGRHFRHSDPVDGAPSQFWWYGPRPNHRVL